MAHVCLIGQPVDGMVRLRFGELLCAPHAEQIVQDIISDVWIPAMDALSVRGERLHDFTVGEQR